MFGINVINGVLLKLWNISKIIYTQNQWKRNTCTCIFHIFPTWTCQSKVCFHQTITFYIFYQKIVLCIDWLPIWIVLIWTLCKDQKSLARMVSDSYQTSYVWLVSPKNKKTAISFDFTPPVAMVTTGGYSALKTALILLKLTHFHHIFIQNIKDIFLKWFYIFKYWIWVLIKSTFILAPLYPSLGSSRAKLAKIGILPILQNPLKSGGFVVISQTLHPC